MTKKVLGVKIDDVSKEEGLKIVEGWLKDPATGGTAPRLVFTPGPEFLVTAQKDSEFKKILNAGDLNLPDGYGLKIFAGITHVVPGVEFMLSLCRLAAEKGWTVGLVGRRFVAETASELIKRYPKIKIGVNDIDLLFVGLGHPKQEKFLYKLKKDEPLKGSSFRVGMGVGGSFDFISGRVPEPSTIYKKLGLKWLGRFLSRPGYMFPKIFKAVVLFPFYLFLAHFPPREFEHKAV